jgi:hypothetical protein
MLNTYGVTGRVASCSYVSAWQTSWRIAGTVVLGCGYAVGKKYRAEQSGTFTQTVQ